MHMWKTLSKGFCNSRESSGKFVKLPQVKSHVVRFDINKFGNDVVDCRLASG